MAFACLMEWENDRKLLSRTGKAFEGVLSGLTVGGPRDTCQNNDNLAGLRNRVLSE
jgi:hypothetical protein